MKSTTTPDRDVGSSDSSADFYAEHNVLRREGFVTRPGNPHCAFKPGTRPLLCRPVDEETGRLLLPNAVHEPTRRTDAR